MGMREMFTQMYQGFDTHSSKIIDMDVGFLFELACEEAPFRGEEDSEGAKDILYGNDAYEKSARLKKLYDEWDIGKCEPLDLKKEGTFYLLNNGFHRIRVAKDKGLKTLKVDLQEGGFILSKHISMLDLRELMKMIRMLFKDFRTLEELDNFLSGKLDERKMKHTFIGFGRLE